MLYQPGEILLGKYRIEELIGQGAFGEVYHVTHLGLNVPRALKIMRKDMPGVGSTNYALFEQRCKLEVQLGARLTHPNVVQVYDLEHQDGTLILVLEYLSGGSLADRIETARQSGQPIAIDDAIRTARDAAEGLAALHALDAVHRDLKPGNILYDAQGRARIADLGLAQIPGGPSMRSQLSIPEPHPGTPTYMSPEQSRSTEYLSLSSDVYSLGLVLFELLTGRVYFHQPQGTRLRTQRPDAPQWLDVLLAKMLAPEPRDRPHDAAAVVAALQAKPVRKRRGYLWWLLGALLVLSLVAVGLVYLFSGTGEEPVQTAIALELPLSTPDLSELPDTGITQQLPSAEDAEGVSASPGVSPEVAGLSAPVTETQIPTPLLTLTPMPTTTPIPTPTTLSTPQPRFYDIRFCDRPCDELGARYVESFPERVKYIYLTWKYEGFYPGMNYRRVWTNNGEEWVHYKCTWQGPKSGVFNLKLWDVDGLRSGTWTMELYIEGQIVSLAWVDVDGSYDFWEPAGHPDCPDF